MTDEWHLRILQPYGDSPELGNVDVEVVFSDGRRYACTFLTIENLQHLMEVHRKTGECLAGSYFWAADLIILRELSENEMRRAIADMILTGEFEMAFRLLDETV